ncbi:MAG: FAD:protein FMN transferase [Deltaproteobacteria bacterium]|nr:FAD:protein FMN transferase [Deltaproteobacteria bacterium]
MKLIGLASLGFVSVSPLIFSWKEQRKLKSVKRTRTLMGTFVTVIVLDDSEAKALEAVEVAFEEMERLTKIFSRFDPDSPIFVLNKNGCLREIHPELQQLFKEARELNLLTNGYFDVTVKPILDLLSAKGNGDSSIPFTDIHEILSNIGMEKIIFRKEEILFSKKGMGITFDGIAKGFIAEKAIEKLKKIGVSSALINAGGDIQVIGDKGGRPWKIGVRDPLKSERIIETVYLKEGSIATSGSYENYFDEDGKLHHLIDPKSGVSPNRFLSTTVIHPSLTVADALATALFVCPETQIKSILSKFHGASLIVVTSTGAKIRITG